jgi:uncharacterized protein YbaR (Trm112 family)
MAPQNDNADDAKAEQDMTPEESGATAALRCDPRVLSMLVCPVTRAELVYDAVHQELLSGAARLAYPIRDGVPVMTPDQARPLDDDDLRRHARR